MKGIAIVLFCATLAAAKPKENNDIRCSVDDEIPKFLPHEYCHKFYQCVGETRISQTCPADLLFDTELQICEWPRNVDCQGRIHPEDRPEGGGEEVQPGGHYHSDPSLAPEICAAEDSEGVLVAHEICNKFYMCNGHGLVTLKCPDNLLYNPKKEQCDWPLDVECGERITLVLEEDKFRVNYFSSNAWNACAQENSEGTLVAHNDCNRFNNCNDGKPVAFNCPAGLMYNIMTEYCDWPSKVECGDRPVAVIEEENVESDNK